MDTMKTVLIIIAIGYIIFSFVVFCGVNAMISLAKVYIVKKKYKKEQSVDKAIYAGRIFFKYFQLPIYIMTSLIQGTIINKFIDISDYLNFFIWITLIGVCFMLTLATDIMISHNTQKLLRKNVLTRREKIWSVTKIIGIITFTIASSFQINSIVSNSDKVISMFGALSIIIFPAIVIIIIVIFLPNIIKYFVKARPLEETVLNIRLNNFVNRLGLDNINFYTCLTKKSKHANAFVYGWYKKGICLTNYMMENIEEEEIEAIVAHEIGHIKKYHLEVRRILGLIAFIPILAVFIMINDDNLVGAYITIIVILIFIFLIKYICRVQENQADDFVVQEAKVDPVIFVKALIKLNKLNHNVFRLNRVDEKFNSHFGMEKRIKRIMKLTNGKVDFDLEEIDSN